MKQRLVIVGCLLLLIAACEVRSDRSSPLGGPLYYGGAHDHSRYGNDGYSRTGGGRWGRDSDDIRSGYTADSGWRL